MSSIPRTEADRIADQVETSARRCRSSHETILQSERFIAESKDLVARSRTRLERNRTNLPIGGGRKGRLTER